MDAGDTDDRGEAGDQDSAVAEFNAVVCSISEFLQQAGGSWGESRQLKLLLGNALQRSAVCFLEDCVYSTSFEPKEQGEEAEKLRRMACLVLRSGAAEFISKDRLPLLLDGSDDVRMKGVMCDV